MLFFFNQTFPYYTCNNKYATITETGQKISNSTNHLADRWILNNNKSSMSLPVSSGSIKRVENFILLHLIALCISSLYSSQISFSFLFRKRYRIPFIKLISKIQEQNFSNGKILSIIFKSFQFTIREYGNKKGTFYFLVDDFQARHL